VVAPLILKTKKEAAMREAGCEAKTRFGAAVQKAKDRD